MQWYYSKNGTQLGPVVEDELRAKFVSGEISLTDLIWKEGMVDWLPASRVPEFVSGMASAAVAPPTMPDMPALGNGADSPYLSPAPSAFHSSSMVGPHIPNYLWQSIVVTLFCCLPFGIVAIVYAAKVDSLRAVGDLARASAASASAKTWCWVSLVSALVPFLIWLLFVIFGLAAAGFQQHSGSF